jgi:hypothetical protein
MAVLFLLPPLSSSSYNSHILWPPQSGQSLRTNTYIQKVPTYNQPNQHRKDYSQFKSAAANTFAHSGLPDDADSNAVARAEGT